MCSSVRRAGIRSITVSRSTRRDSHWREDSRFQWWPALLHRAALGKLETSMVLAELLRRFSTIELAGTTLCGARTSASAASGAPLTLVR